MAYCRTSLSFCFVYTFCSCSYFLQPTSFCFLDSLFLLSLSFLQFSIFFRFLFLGKLFGELTSCFVSKEKKQFENNQKYFVRWWIPTKRGSNKKVISWWFPIELMFVGLHFFLHKAKSAFNIIFFYFLFVMGGLAPKYFRLNWWPLNFNIRRFSLLKWFFFSISRDKSCWKKTRKF